MSNSKSKKILTPSEAYKRLEQMAKKSTVSHWRCRKQKTVLVSTLEKLGIMEA